ncbi:MAG: hypothetical protein QOK40_319 [Miltoncostaeaceae bacterium]|nr:hypothetical protein [Miltoncostaeaceae bacterium]
MVGVVTSGPGGEARLPPGLDAFKRSLARLLPEAEAAVAALTSETGVAAGVGPGDAHALARAIVQHPDDPDAACCTYEFWRAPLIRPYEANDPAGRRPVGVGAAERPAAERWPPVE